MITIKRYPNRKLRGIKAAEYTDLGKIADSVRQGENIQVIEHPTQRDVTDETLTHAIIEILKEAPLPAALATNILRTGKFEIRANDPSPESLHSNSVLVAIRNVRLMLTAALVNSLKNDPALRDFDKAYARVDRKYKKLEGGTEIF